MNSTASIYFSAMSSPVVEMSARRLDAVAVNAALHRLAAMPGVPWLHAEVARRMAEKLQVIRLKPERLIDWWSVLGSGAALLEQAYPQASRLAVEPDAAWAQRCSELQKKPWWSPQRWTGGSATVLVQDDEVPGGSQLVWANMMLHMVTDPPGLIARWHRLLGADGFVMFSCLGPGTLRELRTLYERRGWPAPTPGFVDMHDLGDMLVQAGFADPVMDQEVLTLRWDNPASLLNELRTLGGNTAPDREPGLRTPRWRRELERELAALAGPDGKIGLSFEVAYGHAFKGGPRVRAGEPTKVSLDDMRAMVRSSHGKSERDRPLR